MVTDWAKPGTVTIDSSIGDFNWNNPDNIKLDNGSYATTDAMAGGGYSYYIVASNFGFSVPENHRIDGIEVRYERNTDTATIITHATYLLQDGTIGGENKQDDPDSWATSDEAVTRGSASDLWNRTWSREQINASDFGVAISVENTTPMAGPIASIDYLEVRIHYSAISPIDPAIPSSIVLEEGRIEKRKEYFVKIFSRSGDYIGTYSDISFGYLYKSINGGLGDLNLTIARPFQDFVEGDEIDLTNEVQIWIVDKESGSEGKKIYSGIINAINPYIGAGGEGVRLDCLGYVSRLSRVIYKNGTTVAITKSATDPSNMVKDVIDRFRAETEFAEDPRIYYTAGSIKNTGVSATYTFVIKTCLSALDNIRSFAPAEWYYYVDADNLLTFSNKPTSATHTFTFGKDIIKMEINKNLDGLYNQAILWNGKESLSGGILRSYSDSDSQDRYGLRMENRTDERWGNTDTMDLVGEAFIEHRKVPNIYVTLEVLDSNQNDLGYDIESIEPGHTCKVLNLPTSFATLSDNMTISSVKYELGKVTLELEDLRQSLSKRFVDIRKEQRETVYNEVDIIDYTVVS